MVGTSPIRWPSARQTASARRRSSSVRTMGRLLVGIAAAQYARAPQKTTPDISARARRERRLENRRRSAFRRDDFARLVVRAHHQARAPRLGRTQPREAGAEIAAPRGLDVVVRIAELGIAMLERGELFARLTALAIGADLYAPAVVVVATHALAAGLLGAGFAPPLLADGRATAVGHGGVGVLGRFGRDHVLNRLRIGEHDPDPGLIARAFLGRRPHHV